MSNGCSEWLQPPADALASHSGRLRSTVAHPLTKDAYVHAQVCCGACTTQLLVARRKDLAAGAHIAEGVLHLSLVSLHLWPLHCTDLTGEARR